MGFGLGAAIGVPRVFTAPESEGRLRLLELHRGLWRTALPLYGAGAVVTSLAVGYLASGSADGRSRTALWGACVALLTGALAWGWSLYLRGTRIAAFAFRTLPGWPFAAYVLLTTGGLMLLGVGLLLRGFPTWLGWLTCGASIAFLIVYVLWRDIPPFVSYVLLTAVGVMLL